MIKAKKIPALSIEITGDISATLVQVGEDWNGLSAWRCVSPGAFAGQSVITAPARGGHGFSAVFHGIFARTEDHLIISASPEIGAAIMAASECNSPNPCAA